MRQGNRIPFGHDPYEQVTSPLIRFETLSFHEDFRLSPHDTVQMVWSASSFHLPAGPPVILLGAVIGVRYKRMVI